MKKNISFKRTRKTIKEKGKINRLRYQIEVLKGMEFDYFGFKFFNPRENIGVSNALYTRWAHSKPDRDSEINRIQKQIKNIIKSRENNNKCSLIDKLNKIINKVKLTRSDYTVLCNINASVSINDCVKEDFKFNLLKCFENKDKLQCSRILKFLKKYSLNNLVDIYFELNQLCSNEKTSKK